MAIGPGKYDDLCTAARVAAAAEGAILIILGGHLGSGFCVQGPPHALVRLPDLLESMAKDIRSDMERGEY
jgi:hypothetical protein